MGNIVELIFGLIFAGAGCISIFRRRFSVNFGMGKTGLSLPLFTLTVTKRRSVLFGVGSIFGSTIILLH